MTSQNMKAFLAEFGLEGPRARRVIEDAVKPMLEIIEANSAPLRKIGQRIFDDLIGRELAHLCELLEIGITIRGRDYFEPVGGGWVIS
jgi:serine/threonine-protein kinase HipA